MLTGMLEQVTTADKGVIEPRVLAEALGVTLSDLARIAGVHRNTLARSPASPAIQGRLGEVARILTEASALMGGDARRAAVWFRHQPLAGFDGETAEELVATGKAGAVRDHLRTLRDGGYA
ncbi:MAG: hypothetical protein ABI369_00155 [Acetobacteraceae bacterium]